MNPREGVVEHLVVTPAGVRGGEVPMSAAVDWWLAGGELHEKLRRLAVPRVDHLGYRVRITHGFPDPLVEVAHTSDRASLRWRRASSGVTKAVLRWYAAAMMASKAEAGPAGQRRLAQHLDDQADR